VFMLIISHIVWSHAAGSWMRAVCGQGLDCMRCSVMSVGVATFRCVHPQQWHDASKSCTVWMQHLHEPSHLCELQACEDCIRGMTSQPSVWDKLSRQVLLCVPAGPCPVGNYEASPHAWCTYVTLAWCKIQQAGSAAAMPRGVKDDSSLQAVVCCRPPVAGGVRGEAGSDINRWC
jgi:hypothetical protein